MAQLDLFAKTFIDDTTALHNWVQGDENTIVNVAGGPLDSPRKLIKQWNAAVNLNAGGVLEQANAARLQAQQAAADAASTLAGAAKTADLSAATGSTLIGSQLNATGSSTRTLAKKLEDIPTLFDFIPASQHAAILAGTSVYDCTADIVRAFQKFDTVGAGPGKFCVSSFDLTARKMLLTSGYATLFQQLAGLSGDIRMIRLTGSHAAIVGNISVSGNIATDTGEQRHSIYVQANATNGNLTGIKIGNVRGFDVRGDLVYLGQSNGGTYKLSDCRVGDVYGDNVYRNVVSVVSCNTGIEIGNISGPRVGFYHIDIETNATSGPAIGIQVGYVKGRSIGIIGTTAADYVDMVSFAGVDLNPAYATQSDPPYSPGVAVQDGIQLRNIKRAGVGMFKAEGFGRGALFTIYNAGEIGTEYLEIGNAEINNCSLTDTVYNSYMSLAQSRVKIGYLSTDIGVAGKSVCSGASNSEIGILKANAATGAFVLRSCNDVRVGLWTQTGAGQPISNCQRVSLKGGVIVGARLASGSNKCSFENLTATVTEFLFSSGNEDHLILNSTLNGVYYGYGTGISNYLNPSSYGPYRLWMDTKGVHRIKSGVPTADMDGNPMALKVAVPATATAAGALGHYAVNGTFRYDYIGDGTTHSWVRTSVAAW